MENILITGGSGSFGKAFAAACLREPGIQRICILSRDEHKQAAMRQEMIDEKLRFFIGDVRDKERLRRAMEGIDTVIHAAALKRIEVGVYDSAEMIKTNVMGSMNVIEAAHDAGVQRIVALSTDKACQPISPYGYSKALMEQLFLAANSNRGATGPTCIVTRYGNVWASAGSVAPKWKAMVADGVLGVPVTDPDCTRFFMVMGQAVDLVMQACLLDDPPDEPLTLDLPAYRLRDLAQALGTEMVVTGLPWWEKKHECMVEGKSSADADKLTVDMLRLYLEDV